jgi:uncharacterized protein
VLFVIHAKDKSGALAARLANYDAHPAFLSDTSPRGVLIVTSSPVVADDETTMIGSLFVVETPDRVTVERFNQGDPFNVAGIWENVAITGFLRGQG